MACTFHFRWILLRTYLGDSVAGSKMKEKGNSHWSFPNYATNESGFTALPGGDCFPDGNFWGIGVFTFFWSSTVSSNLMLGISLRCDGTGIGLNQVSDGNGFYVRCIKDN